MSDLQLPYCPVCGVAPDETKVDVVRNELFVWQDEDPIRSLIESETVVGWKCPNGHEWDRCDATAEVDASLRCWLSAAHDGQHMSLAFW